MPRGGSLGASDSRCRPVGGSSPQRYPLPSKVQVSDVVSSSPLDRLRTASQDVRGSERSSEIRMESNTIGATRSSIIHIYNPDHSIRPLPLPWNSSMRSEEHTSELQSRGHLVC